MMNNDLQTEETAMSAKTITALDIECAQISLNSNCDALSAIAKAIKTIAESPDASEQAVIPRLAAHAVYLADSLENDLGCFIDLVEEVLGQGEQQHHQAFTESEGGEM